MSFRSLAFAGWYNGSSFLSILRASENTFSTKLLYIEHQEPINLIFLACKKIQYIYHEAGPRKFRCYHPLVSACAFFIRNWFIRSEYLVRQQIKKLEYFAPKRLRNCAILLCLKKSALTCFHSLLFRKRL